MEHAVYRNGTAGVPRYQWLIEWTSMEHSLKVVDISCVPRIQTSIQMIVKLENSLIEILNLMCFNMCI